MLMVDVNIGLIMGIGFLLWIGGSVQFIVGYFGLVGIGKVVFVVWICELVVVYGDCFLLLELLLS